MNTETTCERLQWLDYNKVTKQENISVITNTESVQIWDVNEASPKYSFTREKISEALKVYSRVTCFSSPLKWPKFSIFEEEKCRNMLRCSVFPTRRRERSSIIGWFKYAQQVLEH